MARLFAAVLVLVFFVSFLGLVVPADSHAQSGLVPCGRSIDDPSTVEDETRPCTVCHGFFLVNNIVQFFLVPTSSNSGFAAVMLLGMLMLATGGFLFMVGSLNNPGLRNKGRSILFTSIIALLIIYASWIVIDFVLSAFGATTWTGTGSWWKVQCAPPPPPPIAHWDFNQGSGTTILGGYSGTLNLGTTGNTSVSAAWVPGKNGAAGTALQLDGIDDFIDMGNVLNMGTNDFSIGFWVKALDGGPGSTYVLGKWSDTAIAGYVVLYDNTGGGGGMISNGLDTSARGLTTAFYNYNAVLSDPTNFHHAVLVVDRQLDMKLYIDGVLDNTDSGGVATEPGSIDNAFNFLIGARSPGIDHTGGIFDDIKIWDTALTPAEVAAEFAAGPQ